MTFTEQPNWLAPGLRVMWVYEQHYNNLFFVSSSLLLLILQSHK